MLVTLEPGEQVLRKPGPIPAITDLKPFPLYEQERKVGFTMSESAYRARLEQEALEAAYAKQLEAKLARQQRKIAELEANLRRARFPEPPADHVDSEKELQFKLLRNKITQEEYEQRIGALVHEHQELLVDPLLPDENYDRKLVGLKPKWDGTEKPPETRLSWCFLARTFTFILGLTLVLAEALGGGARPALFALGFMLMGVPVFISNPSDPPSQAELYRAHRRIERAQSKLTKEPSTVRSRWVLWT